MGLFWRTEFQPLRRSSRVTREVRGQQPGSRMTGSACSVGGSSQSRSAGCATGGRWPGIERGAVDRGRDRQLRRVARDECGRPAAAADATPGEGRPPPASTRTPCGGEERRCGPSGRHPSLVVRTSHDKRRVPPREHRGIGQRGRSKDDRLDEVMPISLNFSSFSDATNVLRSGNAAPARQRNPRFPRQF